MNRVAFVFSSSPHSSSAGREGLDALLATVSISRGEVGVFFICDGVFQIVTDQHPNMILARDYIVTFKLLSLYEIKNIWICSSSMKERGLKKNTPLVVSASVISAESIREKLSRYEIVLTF